MNPNQLIPALANKARANDFAVTNATGAKPYLVCFSHLRCDFVYQRPQHLLTRGAK